MLLLPPEAVSYVAGVLRAFPVLPHLIFLTAPWVAVLSPVLVLHIFTQQVIFECLLWAGYGVSSWGYLQQTTSCSAPACLPGGVTVRHDTSWCYEGLRPQTQLLLLSMFSMPAPLASLSSELAGPAPASGPWHLLFLLPRMHFLWQPHSLPLTFFRCSLQWQFVLHSHLHPESSTHLLCSSE